MVNSQYFVIGQFFVHVGFNVQSPRVYTTYSGQYFNFPSHVSIKSFVKNILCK